MSDADKDQQIEELQNEVDRLRKLTELSDENPPVAFPVKGTPPRIIYGFRIQAGELPPGRWRYVLEGPA